jgi:hypothetical protein
MISATIPQAGATRYVAVLGARVFAESKPDAENSAAVLLTHALHRLRACENACRVRPLKVCRLRPSVTVKATVS